MRLPLSFFLILFVILSFSSCSILGSYYFINKSDQDVHLLVESKYDDSLEIRIGLYDEQKLKLKSYRKLEPLATKSNPAEFKLESGQIAFIGYGSNTSYWGSVFIIEEGTREEIDVNDHSKIKLRRGGLGNYLGVIEYY